MDSHKLNDALIAILIPALGFFFTYCVQIAYCNYYNIPLMLISVDGRNISEIASAALVIFIVIMGWESILAKFLLRIIRTHSVKERIHRQIYNFIFIYCFLIAGISSMALFSDKAIIYVPLLSILALFVCSAIFTHLNKDKPTQIDIYRLLKNESEEIDKSIDITILNKNLGFINKYILLLMIGIALSYGYGHFLAKNQTDYYRVDNRNDIAGITIYNNSIISKRIIDHKIVNEIVIIQIKDGTILQKVEIGKL